LSIAAPSRPCAPIDATLNGVDEVLLAAPSLMVIAIIGLLAWQFTRGALAVGHRLALLVALGIWPEAMVTLSLVLTSLLFCW
jgi:ABC-type proline/glycine betaine transport system permease subunit